MVTRFMKSDFIGKTLLAAALLLLGMTGSAHATDVTEISENMVESVENLPGLVTALSYLSGLLFGVLGIFKLKEHVDNPNKAELRESMIRFLAGGALFALPIVYESMCNSISGTCGGDGAGGGGWAMFDFGAWIGGLIGGIGGFFGGTNFNDLLGNIIESVEGVPGLITAGAYLLGLVMGVSGILKMKEHVDSPQNTQLREPVIRFLIGGALFALPVIFNAMKETIDGGGAGAGDIFTMVLGSINTMLGIADCGPSVIGALFGLGGGGGTMGEIVCNIYSGTSGMIAFLGAAAYLFGIVIGIWGLLKIKDHVLNPQQTSIWEGISRLVAGGAFFGLPSVAMAAKNTIGALSDFSISGAAGAAAGDGLDAMMARFVDDVYGPVSFLINWFGFVAGTVLIMVGISRLLKSAQEGPRGPGGIGTIMTFILAGALMSFGPMVGMMGETLFGDSEAATIPELQYTTGMDAAEIAHVHAVISAVIQFMIILGLISFARGLFIIRDVAEGNQQASMMAGITHILGGAMAVNLGPVMNAVQTTFGLEDYGVVFG